jgi:outer membrane protein assembly factor BamD
VFSSQLSQLLPTLLRRCLFIVMVVLLASCATKVDETANWDNNKLYSEAKDNMDNGLFEKAIGYFEKLEGRAAGTVLAQQAQLDKAWCQYKNKELAQAIATLDRFIKLHPASPALDYAYYLKGVINFNEDLGLITKYWGEDLAERDPKQARDSFDAFRDLVVRFPDSQYSADARSRMIYIKNSLARSDVYVARFYYKKGAYVAAISRAQNTVQEYRDVPAVEEALYIMMQSYDKLGLTQLRDDTRRVLERTYPDSPYITGDKETKAWWKLW